MDKPKCSWCGDIIHRRIIYLQDDKYHAECVQASLRSFELPEIKNALIALKQEGTDVFKALKLLIKLDRVLATLR